MTPSHHPDHAVLMDYAAGSLREPVAVLIATHLALCPACRTEVRRLESLGGALLDELEPASLQSDSLARVMERLDEPEPAPAIPLQKKGAFDPVLPRPLRDYVDGSLEQLFADKGRGRVAEVDLLEDFPGYATRLLRIRAGAGVPKHTHGGTEMTMVLAGGFSDHTGHYLRGDIAAMDSTVTHQPVADPGEDCYCLAVTDAPLKLVGPFGRLLNPFVRF